MTVSTAGIRPSASLPSVSTVTRIIKTVLRREKAPVRGDLNVIFVDNKKIRQLNKRFLNEQGVTDVIAFPYENPPGEKYSPIFGDIYISVPVAKRNAADYGEPTRRELIRLVIHGLLHLLGYQDHGGLAKKKMWAKQELYTNLLSPQKQIKKLK